MIEYTTLEGILERIVFFNEENNFTVARLQSGHSRNLITIVGNLPDEELRQSAMQVVTLQVTSLVDMAKVDALDFLGDSETARELAELYL
jgi:hypothetical protein